MPCGCSGGTWQPPEDEERQDENGERKSVPAAKPEPAVTGPAAPGYYHGPDR